MKNRTIEQSLIMEKEQFRRSREPHGVACAMMLPIVMEYNAECSGKKYCEIARAVNVADVDKMSREEYCTAAIEAVKKLSADVRIPAKLEAGYGFLSRISLCGCLQAWKPEGYKCGCPERITP